MTNHVIVDTKVRYFTTIAELETFLQTVPTGALTMIQLTTSVMSSLGLATGYTGFGVMVRNSTNQGDMMIISITAATQWFVRFSNGAVTVKIQKAL